MALGNKTSQPFYVTSGGGQDEINATRKAIIDSAFTADKLKGSAQLIDDQILGPLVYNIQRMQDDLDEVRRFTLANEPKVGSTFDATTDFTVGTSVITDGQIQFTPSAGDTATISAATHGALNITTADASTPAQGHITLTSDGSTKIDASSNISLDTGDAVDFALNGVSKGGIVPAHVPLGGQITTPMVTILDINEATMNTLSSANSNKGILAIPGVPGLSIIVTHMTTITTMDSSTQQTVQFDGFLTYDGVKNMNETIYYKRRWMHNASTGYGNQEEWGPYRGIQTVLPRTSIGTGIYFTASANPTTGSINSCRLIITYIVVKN